jgi:hypothetical protein
MVIRLLVCLFFLVATIFTPLVSEGLAGGPPGCAPPPYYCGPPRAGLPSPITICGSVLGACTSICGVVCGIPAMVMSGLLAPSPCLPPVRGPMAYCPPRYIPAPCYPVRRIAKCRPVGPRYYHPTGGYVQPYSPVPPAMRFPGTPVTPPPLAAEDGPVPSIVKLAVAPLRLVSGALTTKLASAEPEIPGALASASGKSSRDTIFGCYW